MNYNNFKQLRVEIIPIVCLTLLIESKNSLNIISDYQRNVVLN